MSKKTLALIGFATLIAAAAAFLQAATPKDPGEGKFHLVYLVAAVDLKPGSRATVDPIFFTNGREVRNFHDFCHKRNIPLKQSQVADDLNFVGSYCNNNAFTLSPKTFYTLNNHGQQVRLNAIDFRESEAWGDYYSSTGEHRKVLIGYTTLRQVTPGAISVPELLRSDIAPQHFFLMSNNRYILEKIIPRAKSSNPEIEMLLTRVRVFTQKVKGMSSCCRPNDVKTLNSWKSPLPLVRDVSIANPIFADIDGDQQLDVVVGAHAVFSGRDGKPVDWVAISYILNNGHSGIGPGAGFMGWRGKDVSHFGRDMPHFEQIIANNYAVNTPLVVLRLYGCRYVMRYAIDPAFEVPTGVYFESPADVGFVTSKSCTRIGVLPKLQNAP